jgi:hypothetical protein
MGIVALDVCKILVYLNGFSKDASLLDENQNITVKVKDSTGDSLPDFTGDRRAILLRIGGKLWHRNVDFDKKYGTDDKDDWYDVMATTSIISHMERRTILDYDETWNRTVMAVYDPLRDVSVLPLVECR